MADNLKPEDRRKTMQAVKGKCTKIEKCFSSMLAGMRFKGWKKNAADVIGKPDIIFRKSKVAIFIDGCFWHGCPFCGKKLPKTNRSYWKRKIARNMELANNHNKRLIDAGWTVIRIWEHELINRTQRQKIRQILRNALISRRR